MEKVLQLVFKKADGKQKVLNVTDPREMLRRKKRAPPCRAL